MFVWLHMVTCEMLDTNRRNKEEEVVVKKEEGVIGVRVGHPCSLTS